MEQKKIYTPEERKQLAEQTVNDVYKTVIGGIATVGILICKMFA